MSGVKPKKRLGQHFLKDKSIAEKIVNALSSTPVIQHVIEIGPGTGVLSDILISRAYEKVYLMDVDKESIDFLEKKIKAPKAEIHHADFLKINLLEFINGQDTAIIGNFPYNISSQIFFKILDHKNDISEVVCMIQKEVADRIVSDHGSKVYGILSVLLQAYYDIEYLFTVEPNVFIPPPKVRSAVIRLKRNDQTELGCDEILFRRLVKQGFQMRRKTLRNALKPLNLPNNVLAMSVLNNRAEQLSVQDFIELTNKISE